MPRLAPRALPLADPDVATLRESGLDLGRLVAAGWRTGQDPYGNPALVIPYRDLNGGVNCYCRYRPHKPRVGKDGKAMRYVQPAGAPNRAYFPPDCLDALREGTGPVLVTEAEKKAEKVAQSGHVAVGLGGVWNWTQGGTGELIPDLAAIPWAGRDGYVVFDYDEKPATRENVRLAALRLAAKLREAGAREVYFVELPPGPGGKKQGADDYIVAHGAKAFADLVREARPAPPDDGPRLTNAEGQTDAANAKRLALRHRDVLRWVGPWDKFLLWDGTRWRLDDALRVHALAKGVAADLWAQVAAVGKGDGDAAKRLVRHAAYSSGLRGLEAMVSLARSEPGVPVAVADLDADPWLLNVLNGTIDLRTGELREHRREDYVTKLAPVAYDPDAECPTWEAFLATIFAENAELTGYVRRLVGYSLTGATTEHLLPFLHGSGANGKSTFVELLMRLLGTDYAMKAGPDLLMARRGEAHPTERADLFGKRFVACVESDEGRRLAESLVKELTGGDRVRARRMREDFWEFAPTHHVFLVSNHKPTIVGSDHGIWRRVKLIPFEVTIPEADQDKALGGKLAAELPGILRWAVAGCLDWHRGGMREPECVRVATAEYSAEMDEVGQFVEAYCLLGEAYVEGGGDLFRAFREAYPDSRLSAHSFGARLRGKGFTNRDPKTGKEVRLAGAKAWRGLRLKGSQTSAQAASIAADFGAFFDKATRKK